MSSILARASGWVAGVLGLAFCAPAFAAAPNWTFDAYIRVPYRNTLFTAMDSHGNLYGTTFNNSPNADTVVAFKVTDPAGAAPTVTAIDQAQVPTFRGYSGIAVDEADNVYVAVDGGDPAHSYTKKLLPNGSPDADFGDKGIVAAPGIRYQGLAAAGGRLIAAESWGRVAILDAKSGKTLSESPAPTTGQNAITIRDIAFVPATQEILGIDRDTVYVFTGASLENAATYKLQPLVEGQGKQTAGEGIFYQPGDDRIYYTRTGLGHLGTAIKAQAKPEVIETVGTMLGGPLSEPADAVASQDGAFLYVSDLRAPVILRYRTASAGTTLAAGSSAVPDLAASGVATTSSMTIASTTIAPLGGTALTGAPPPGESVAGGATSNGTPGGGTHVNASPSIPVTVAGQSAATPNQAVESSARSASGDGSLSWETGDLRRALSKAFASKRRLVAFFTAPDAQLARDVEAEVFNSPGFAAQYPDAIFLRLNLATDRSDVEHYGVFRVPTVILFSGTGQEIKRLSGFFSREDFAKAYAVADEPTHR